MINKIFVKGLGPIKKAEVELKDVTVLIGPTGVGKSTLAELISKLSGSENLFNSVFNSDFKKSTKANKFGFEMPSVEDLKIDHDEKIVWPIFIPAERSFYSLVENISFILLEEKAALPGTIVNFGSRFQQARNALDGGVFNTHIFGSSLTYRFQNGLNQLIQKNKSFQLKDSASGIQTTLPMLLVINYLLQEESEKYLFIIEEPEINLYPEAQQKLIEFLVCNCAKNGNKLLITTHSPYTLSALNNLIQANNVVKNHNELSEKVNEIIPFEYWLDYENVSAYYMGSDGLTHSILDDENKLIVADELDGISTKMGDDFDKLIDLEFSPEA